MSNDQVLTRTYRKDHLFIPKSANVTSMKLVSWDKTSVKEEERDDDFLYF